MPKKLLLSIYFFILSAAFISGCGIIKKADESKESKIGVILSLSGENSDYGKSSKMALDLLKEENSEKVHQTMQKYNLYMKMMKVLPRRH